MNHFTVRELYDGCKLALSSGVHMVTDVEPSDSNVLVHHTGGTFECGLDDLFLSIGPGTFEPLV